MNVAFQGERGAFGELAAAEYFGSTAILVPLPEFRDVCRAVLSGRARYGVLPIENSMAGSIHQNYDLLLENRVWITGEIYLRVSHCLIANHGVLLHNVRRIYSHPQGLAQCRAFLSRLSRAELFAVSNTAKAVKMIKDQKLTDAAAVASMQAAIDYDMHILARAIEDNTTNTTRFLIIAKKPLRSIPAKRPAKTSIVFATKNIPGALFRALSVFALRDINLHKIESRPLQGRHFEYLFYLDFEGNADDAPQNKALAHLQEITTLYRLLGSYPVGRLAHPKCRRRK